jgi:RNA polymerase sigma factor (sigma-70 family)
MEARAPVANLTGMRTDAMANDLPDYRALGQRLTAWAKRMGSADPDDAVQKTLMQAWTNPISHAVIEGLAEGTLDEKTADEWPPDRLFAWLYVIMQRIVAQERHSAYARRVVPINPNGPEPVDMNDDPQGQLLATERLARMARCLAALDPPCRERVKMFGNGMSKTDIARLLDVNKHTMQDQVARCLKKLAQLLRNDHGPSSGDDSDR